MAQEQRHKSRTAIVTIKGKARDVDLSAKGLGRLRVNIIKWKGHKQVELTALDSPDERLTDCPPAA